MRRPDYNRRVAVTGLGIMAIFEALLPPKHGSAPDDEHVVAVEVGAVGDLAGPLGGGQYHFKTIVYIVETVFNCNSSHVLNPK